MRCVCCAVLDRWFAQNIVVGRKHASHHPGDSSLVYSQELMLTKQSEVLSNLANLDEEEAVRAESASLRWRVSSPSHFS